MKSSQQACLASLLARASIVWAVASLSATSQLSAQVPSVPPPPAVIVPAGQVNATISQSTANNTLDTKMAETRVEGGIVRVGVIYRTRPEARALVHQELTEIYQIVEGAGTLVTGGTVEDAQSVSDPPNLP